MQKEETHLGAPLISDTQRAESLVPVEVVYHHTILNVSNGYFHIFVKISQVCESIYTYYNV